MTNHHYTETATPDATKRYPSDLNDQEFDLIAPHVAQKAGSGNKRTVDIREVLNAIFYRIRTGCQWRMLPSDFPAWYHVWYYYRKWRNDGTLQRINTLLRREVRIQEDRDPEPSVAIIDSQSIALDDRHVDSPSCAYAGFSWTAKQLAQDSGGVTWCKGHAQAGLGGRFSGHR